MGFNVLRWSAIISFNPRKKLSLILYRAIENAGPFTVLEEMAGSRVARLYSADSLNKFRIIRATEEKVNLFLRVKSVLLSHNNL